MHKFMCLQRDSPFRMLFNILSYHAYYLTVPAPFRLQQQLASGSRFLPVYLGILKINAILDYNLQFISQWPYPGQRRRSLLWREGPVRG